MEYSEFIDGQEVLKLFPDTVSVEVVAPALERLIPVLVHRKNNAEVLKNLSRGENLDVC
jgi:hypothetical protein